MFSGQWDYPPSSLMAANGRSCKALTGIDIDKILALAPSPAYVVDLGRLRHNLAILDDVQRRSGAKILMALKAFSMWSVFPIIRETLQGVCASSLWEARLGREEFGGEVHSFAAAFSEDDIRGLLPISNHLVFNSFAQLERFRVFPADQVFAAICRRGDDRRSFAEHFFTKWVMGRDGLIHDPVLFEIFFHFR